MTNNKRNIDINYLLPYIILGIVFILNNVMLVKYGKNNLNSDMASEMVLANLMNEDNDLLFCKNWAYSTEIRVIYLQAAFRLGLLLFPNNWYYARVFGTDLMMILLIISFIHLCKTLKIEKYGVWLSIILLLPISNSYFSMMGYGGFYIPHTILFILLTDLLISYLNKKSTYKFVLIIILGIIGGLNGVRIGYNYLLPLFTVSIIVLFVFDKPKNLLELIKIYIDKYKILVCEYAGVIIGLLINVLILKNTYTFASVEDFGFEGFDFESFINMFVHIFELFGWKSAGAIFNKETFYTGFAVVFFIVLIIAFIWFILNIKKIIGENDRLIFSFMMAIPITFIECDLVFNLFRQNQSRYWITFIPFCLIAIGYYLTYSIHKKIYKALAICILLISIFMTSLYTIRSFASTGKDDIKTQVVNYLIDNNLTQGYASFWNANVLTELSNGQIDVWSAGDRFLEDDKYYLYDWLQDVRHFSNEPNNKKIFLLLVDGTDFIDSTNIEEYKEKQIGPYNIYTFDNYQQIKQFMNTRSSY